MGLRRSAARADGRERGLPIVPRGGGTGYAGGSVPIDGVVVVSLERLTRGRRFDPLLWRIELEAGPGIGYFKTGHLGGQWNRRAFDPKGLFNPGKKG